MIGKHEEGTKSCAINTLLALNREYAKIVNIFTVDFSKEFVTDGRIGWDELVRFNSSKDNTES